jgi:hypothetical protein
LHHKEENKGRGRMLGVPDCSCREVFSVLLILLIEQYLGCSMRRKYRRHRRAKNKEQRRKTNL